jgi:acyl carrier protein
MQNLNSQISTMSTDLNSLESENKDKLNKQLLTGTEIQKWLVSYVAQLLNISEKEIDVTVSFDRYGLDSLAAVNLSSNLEKWLGCEIDPTILYDYPTIKDLAQYLAEEVIVKA